MLKNLAVTTRPKTLRNSVRPSSATLHQEITMLLHQQRRIESELERAAERTKFFTAQMEATCKRIIECRKQSDALDPQCVKNTPAASQGSDGLVGPSSIVPAKTIESESVHEYRQMPLSY
jgi:hypothetical protein